MWKRLGAATKVLLTLFLGACSTGADTLPSEATGGTDGDASVGSSDATGAGAGTPVEPIGQLSGKVVAPEGTIPISGARVYLTTTAPPAIPEGVHCDRCLDSDPSMESAVTNADGTFDVPVYSTGKSYLVVQKGRFRRVRQLTLTEGSNQADPTATRLPSRMDKANGDDIPKMVIQEGTFENPITSLVRLGIDQDQITVCRLSDCASAFDDQDAVNQHQIAFVPSSTCTAANVTQAQVIRNFVEGGGKLIVTDWSYQWMTNAFPGRIDFELVSSEGDACTVSEYDPLVRSMDSGLEAWLAAQGISSPGFSRAYARIAGTNTLPGTDVDGEPTMVTPITWVTGNTPNGDRALAVSFEQRCGRVLYSTYRSGVSSSLLPQDLAFFYMVLEMDSCVGEPAAL